MKFDYSEGIFRMVSRSAVNKLLRSRVRFVLPPVVVTLLKIAGIFWMLRMLRGGKDLISLFHGWDSIYYMSIATTWYPREVVEVWAFFPLYPYLSSITNQIIHDIWASTALVSFIFGIIWLPVYQSIAEKLMDPGEAFTSSIIFALFPEVFVFTTVAYSEPIFLFATLAAWFLYLRGRVAGACISACFAALTRPYGILITLPIILGLLQRRSWRKLPLVLLPFASLMGWVWYGFTMTGDYLAFFSAQKIWTSRPWQPGNWLSEFLLPLLGFEPLSQLIKAQLISYVFLVPFVAIAIYLIFKSIEFDWKLGTYGVMMLTVIVLFGTPLSASRFLPFVFPIWLSIKSKNPIIVFSVSALFFLYSLALWLLFISNVWIG